MGVLSKIHNGVESSFGEFLIGKEVIIEGYEFSVLSQSPLSETVVMEIEFIGLHVAELLVNSFQVAESSIKFSSLQKRLGSLDNVPVVLQLIRIGLISHEQSHHILGCLRFSALEQVLHANVVHVPVSQICLSCLVYSLQSLNVVVHLVLDFGFHNVKL